MPELSRCLCCLSFPQVSSAVSCYPVEATCRCLEQGLFSSPQGLINSFLLFSSRRRADLSERQALLISVGDPVGDFSAVFCCSCLFVSRLHALQGCGILAARPECTTTVLGDSEVCDFSLGVGRPSHGSSCRVCLTPIYAGSVSRLSIVFTHQGFLTKASRCKPD